MKLKYLLLIQICCFVILIAGNARFILAQGTSNVCKTCVTDSDNIPKNEIVCVSSKYLRKSVIFISELYAPSTASLTKIKDKTVYINVIVNKEGRVITAVAIKGHPALKPIALAIVYKAKFKPKKSGNKIVNMCGRLVLKWNPKN
jgi:hypothetical protein